MVKVRMRKLSKPTKPQNPLKVLVWSFESIINPIRVGVGPVGVSVRFRTGEKQRKVQNMHATGG